MEEVLIIGAGVAGLGCAQRLQVSGIPFRIITKDIGGRIQESQNHQVNYGAYYVTADYTHIKPMIQLGRTITPYAFEFHHLGRDYPLPSISFWKYLPQFLRLRSLLKTFRKHLTQFRLDSTHTEQADLITQNPYLRSLFFQSASDFIRQHKLSALFKDYIEEPLYATSFVAVNEMQAFDLLWLAQPLIVQTNQYSFYPSTISQDIQKAITFDTVTALTKQPHDWLIQLQSGQTHSATYVVCAVPTPVMQQLLHTTDGRRPVNAYMHHVSGQLKPTWNKRRYNVFEVKSNIIAITTESDQTHLVYTRQPYHQLNELFTDHTVIATKEWIPAFNCLGTTMIKQDRGAGLYVAGEHNICTLEDAYITGIYAANQIIAQLT